MHKTGTVQAWKGAGRQAGPEGGAGGPVGGLHLGREDQGMGQRARMVLVLLHVVRGP